LAGVSDRIRRRVSTPEPAVFDQASSFLPADVLAAKSFTLLQYRGERTSRCALISCAVDEEVATLDGCGGEQGYPMPFSELRLAVVFRRIPDGGPTILLPAALPERRTLESAVISGINGHIYHHLYSGHGQARFVPHTDRRRAHTMREQKQLGAACRELGGKESPQEAHMNQTGISLA